jgi:DNA-binding MarR family transcriptional regulator
VTSPPAAARDVLRPDEVRDEEVDMTFLVWLTARAASDLVHSALAADGLTGDEFAIYSMLSAPTPTTPSSLARWMAAPATTVTSYVKRFEARGHVQREINSTDRRSYHIRLTDAGRQAHQRAQASFSPLREALVLALGESEPEVREALLTLREALDRVRSSGADARSESTANSATR